MRKTFVLLIFFVIAILLNPISPGVSSLESSQEVTANNQWTGPAVIDVGVILRPNTPFRLDGIKAAAYEINQSNSFNFDINLQVAYTDAGSVAAYNELKASGDIKLIIAPISSSAVTPVAELASNDGIVVISPTATSPSLSDPTYTHFWRTIHSDAKQFHTLADLMCDQGFRNTIVVHRDILSDYANTFEQQFTRKPSTFVSKISYPSGTVDFTDTVNEVKNVLSSTFRKTGDSILLLSFVDDGANLVTKLRSEGVDLPLYSWEGMASESLQDTNVYGPSIQTDTHLLTGTQLSNGTVGEYRYNQFLTSLNYCYATGICLDSNPHNFADYAYDALMVGANAIKLSGQYADGNLINAEMHAAGAGYIGATGPKEFDSVGDQVYAKFNIWQFENGQKTTVGEWSTKEGLSLAQRWERWAARYNGPGNRGDGASAMAVDASGNIYVTGRSWGSGTGSDYATIKYDPAGTEQWVTRYNGLENGNDVAYAIAVDASGNIYVTGRSSGSGTYDDYATIKYDPAGTEQWVARYNGLENS
ncbi:MAG: ABC transporter substrate-binding protein, partial [Candidatus Hodarchaeales archaeon]